MQKRFLLRECRNDSCFANAETILASRMQKRFLLRKCRNDSCFANAETILDSRMQKRFLLRDFGDKLLPLPRICESEYLSIWASEHLSI